MKPETSRLFQFHQLGLLTALLIDSGASADFIVTNMADVRANGTAGTGLTNILNWFIANGPALLQLALSIFAALSAAGM